MSNTLFLRLEGPMQSWGERARWSMRDTASEPTKSGVVGLLGCALGMWSDEELRDLCESVSIGVRSDRPGLLIMDYHTVFGGVLSAEGRIKITQSTGARETVVSERFYLCDSSFLLAVRTSPEWVSRIAEAIQAPCWPVYLGRKSCPPSRPLFEGQGDYESLESALESKPTNLPDRPEGQLQLRAVVESERDGGVRRRDELLSRSCRTFGPRYVRELLITVSNQPEEAHVSEQARP